MNTIRFLLNDNVDIDKLTVKNLERKDIVYNGVKYNIFNDINLNIYTTRRCNASCEFCMNKYEDNFLKAKEIIDDDEYIKRLDEVLKKVKAFNPTISITGGEPTLYPERLIRIIRLLKKYNYGKRTFFTNGLNLLKKEKGKILFDYLKESEFSRNISISRMAIDDIHNDNLMRFGKNKVNNNDIKNIIKYAANDVRLRLSCCLHREGISNKKQLLEYIEFYKELGVKSILFRELIPMENDKDENIKKYNERIIRCTDIINNFKEDNEFKLIKKEEGATYNVELYKYKNYIVEYFIDNVIYKNENTIKDLFFYPNGDLYISWKKEHILDKYV